MKIAVVGLGYVGLSNAILLAQNNEVIATDIVSDKVEKVNNRISPIVDKEIEYFFAERPLKLTATVACEDAYKDAEYVIISTPTNYDEDKQHFDTSSVENAIQTVLAVNKEAVIVIKSTVPVGYGKRVTAKFGYSKILFSPEFLREGRALYDNLYPSRIIVGYNSEDMKGKAEEFASLLANGAVKKDVPVLLMSTTEAEAVKLFANTYLALRISYFNELDTYCEVKGLDTKNVVQGIGLDPRIGLDYNNPSFGYGGYCLPKDTKQLKANYKDVPENLISAIVSSNETRKDFIAKEITEMIGRKGVVGIYRLTMKANSDNFRQSAIQGIIDRLVRAKKRIVIYEPTYNGEKFKGCKVVKSLEEFKNLSTIIVANRMEGALLDVKDKVFTRDIFARD